MTETPPPDDEREPVAHKLELHDEVQLEDSYAPLIVERGLNETRLAVLGILVGIGFTVGFAVGGALWSSVLWGLGAFALACVLVRWRRSRHLLMKFMHWLTGHWKRRTRQ